MATAQAKLASRIQEVFPKKIGIGSLPIFRRHRLRLPPENEITTETRVERKAESSGSSQKASHASVGRFDKLPVQVLEPFMELEQHRLFSTTALTAC